MDLKDLKESSEEDLIDVPLLFDEDGNPTDGFKVVGVNSDEYQEADRAWRVRNVQKAARRGRAIEAATKPGAQELVLLTEKRELALVSACLKEVYGFLDDGKPMPPNEDTLKKIFAKRPTWRFKTLQAIEAEQVFTNTSSDSGEPSTVKGKQSQTVA
jgi:hypothetical protein